METVNFRNKDMYWDIAADLHFPPNFDETKNYPAIISAHPIGSCKEQTSGNVYGAALAEAGFVVIAFDRSFQGASGGEPRSIEDPTQSVEDFRHVADYLRLKESVYSPDLMAGRFTTLRSKGFWRKQEQRLPKMRWTLLRVPDASPF